MKRIFLFLVTFSFLSTFLFAQGYKLPEASPICKLHQQFSTSFIDITYSRPSLHGRKMFGNLIMYGKMWRAGANVATHITFGEDVQIAGKAIAAGTYVLYVVPNETQWEIIFNRGIKNWGLSGYQKKDDVLRVSVPVASTQHLQETLNFMVENITNNSCDIQIVWEHTRVNIPIKVDNESRISMLMDKALKSENPPYMRAARYYFERGDFERALQYVNQALAGNPDAFYMRALKADILAKMHRKKEALEEVRAFTEKAKGTPYEVEYMKRAERIQQSLR